MATKGVLFVVAPDYEHASRRELFAIDHALQEAGAPSANHAVVRNESDVFDAIVRYRPAVLHVTAAPGNRALPFAPVFKGHRKLVDLVLPPRLAVLNRCFSRPQAVRLAQTVGRAIGLPAIDDDLRRIKAFYASLARTSDPAIAARDFGSGVEDVVAEGSRPYLFRAISLPTNPGTAPLELRTTCYSAEELAEQDDLDFGQAGFFARGVSLPKDARVDFRLRYENGTVALGGRGTVITTNGGTGIRFDELDSSHATTLDEILTAKAYRPIVLGRGLPGIRLGLADEGLNVEGYTAASAVTPSQLEPAVIRIAPLLPPDLTYIRATDGVLPSPPRLPSSLDEDFQSGAIHLNAWFRSGAADSTGHVAAYALFVALGKLIEHANGAVVPPKTANTLRNAADDISIVVVCPDARVSPRSQRLVLHGPPVAFDVQRVRRGISELHADLILCVRGEPVFQTRVSHAIAPAAAELHP